MERLMKRVKKNNVARRWASNVRLYLLKMYSVFLTIDNNQLIISANSSNYNDSPKAIFEQIMLEKKLSNIRIVWVLEDPNQLPIKYRDKVKVVLPGSFNYFKSLLTSKYWLASVGMAYGLELKNKKTIYLNTWHGIPIKKIGNAAKNERETNWNQLDYMCYSNEDEKNIYIRDFKINNRSMIPTGLPRNDELFKADRESTKKLKRKMNLETDKKIILYMPTWRKTADTDNNYEIDLPIDWNLWEQRLSDDYIILLKVHPMTAKVMNIEYNDFILNYNDYPFVNDLYIISDILITDYSSALYDYAILEKPILCFAYDYEEYKNNRGIYINLEKEMSNRFFTKELDVLNKIQTMDYAKESILTKKIKEEKIIYGGDAVRQCIEIIFKEEMN